MAWVSFGKQGRVTFPERRSVCLKPGLRWSLMAKRLPLPPEIRQLFVAAGRTGGKKGGSKGGKAAAAGMTATQRRERALKASMAALKARRKKAKKAAV